MNITNENPGHTSDGTKYGGEAATAYIQTTHHSDRQRFLSGFIEGALSDLTGLNVIDIGAGTGPWSIFAAQHGAAAVTAIDYQREMIDQAQQAVSKAGLTDKIHVEQGDAATLKSESAIYDLALSIQVGCNLPQSSFERHIDELARVLQTGGKAVITAPDSFGTVFYGGQQSMDEVSAEIKLASTAINDSDDLSTKMIQGQLTKLTNIYLATFVLRDGKLILVTDEHNLQPGEEIWRKLPGLVVPNYYHSVSQYKAAFEKAHLTILQEYNSGFASEDERAKYNNDLPPKQKLSESYIKNAPFAVWVLQKE